MFDNKFMLNNCFWNCKMWRYLAKYMEILGKVCGDTWQSMWRYLAKYVEILGRVSLLLLFLSCVSLYNLCVKIVKIFEKRFKVEKIPQK